MNLQAHDDDPVLLDDWHPVASAAALPAGTVVAATLLGRDIALWRGDDGVIHAWEDRCPHRGTRFSIGRVEADGLVCAYHAWRFDPDGRCTTIPAMPLQRPPAAAAARVWAATERYGLIWVCVGIPAGEVLPFPEHADNNLNKVVCGPYDVATSGPRVVENFLDMAHFPFVHTGILGAPEHTEVRDYKVESWDDGQGGTGVLATGCFFWQPQTNSLAHGGSDVEYTYRVVRPLTAILTKVPQAQEGFREAISLHVQPVAPESSRVWIVLALTNFVQPDAELRAFQDRIFLQDKPIVENQVPKRLPLAAGAEVPMACDRMSQAYRALLRSRGMTYGVVP
jgi:phenylpropionate dioxygenase-like ring-hydroxylating dioxygenase large terminal subunit